MFLFYIVLHTSYTKDYLLILLSAWCIYFLKLISYIVFPFPSIFSPLCISMNDYHCKYLLLQPIMKPPSHVTEWFWVVLICHINPSSDFSHKNWFLTLHCNSPFCFSLTHFQKSSEQESSISATVISFYYMNSITVSERTAPEQMRTSCLISVCVSVWAYTYTNA